MKKIDIILPNRIGDAVLSLPLMLCLKQLEDKYKKGNCITILPPSSLCNLFESLNLFKVKELNCLSKLQSFINPPDITFFMMTTSQNLGYCGKKKYGEVFPHKKLIKYDVNTQYLDFDYARANLPKELQEFLRNEYKLSRCSIRSFGFCYDLGYSTEDIISTFKFNTDYLNPQSQFSSFNIKKLPEKYIVICPEAAYGKKADSDRRWNIDNYFKIADFIYEKHNISAVFIGIDNKIKLPDKKYICDLRTKINLSATAKVILSSIGYIGNDTGPLHLSNLLKKKTLGIYFREGSTTDYSPIFYDLNKIILNPESIQKVLDLTDFIFN